MDTTKSSLTRIPSSPEEKEKKKRMIYRALHPKNEKCPTLCFVVLLTPLSLPASHPLAPIIIYKHSLNPTNQPTYPPIHHPLDPFIRPN